MANLPRRVLHHVRADVQVSGRDGLVGKGGHDVERSISNRQHVAGVAGIGQLGQVSAVGECNAMEGANLEQIDLALVQVLRDVRSVGVISCLVVRGVRVSRCAGWLVVLHLRLPAPWCGAMG